MRVCLFEDQRAADLEPLCLTRPTFALLCGCTPLADKQLRLFDRPQAGALVRPHLAEVVGQAWPGWRVNDLAWLRAGPAVLVNGRWLPGPGVLPDRPCVGLVGDEVAFAVLGPAELRDCSPLTVDACLERWRESLPAVPAGGRLPRYLWEVVECNAEAVAADVWWQAPRLARPEGGRYAVVGPADRLFAAASAHIDPMVVIDTTAGPVVLDREARVGAFSHLQGPCYVGPGTRVLGARVRAGTCIGPECRIGGEVEASTVQGYTNKAHDGFLGHSFVGEWVNLGAGTSSSDLRNDYGPVRVVVDGRLVQTWRNKVGCFLGDHTKAGLAALLNTGTRAGVFAGLLPGGGLLPRDVPSFATACGGEPVAVDAVEPLLKAADRVMRRRGRCLDGAYERLYRGLFERERPAVGYELRQGA